MITNKTHKIFISVLLLSTIESKLHATIFALNAFRPYDYNLIQPQWGCSPFKLSGYVEAGISTHGFNSENIGVNALQIWTPSQNILAMLNGFPADSPLSQFVANNFPDVPDDGATGYVIPTGDFSFRYGAGIMGKYYFPHNIIFGLYLPFYSMSLKNVQFQNLTPSGGTAEQIAVQDLLMAGFPQNLSQFDPTLDVNGWKRTGAGDLTAMLEWWRSFPQRKPILKNVDLEARFGVSLPTGLRENINQIFSVPFGFDGSVGFIFGGGIILTWFGWEHAIRGGMHVELYHLFGSTRVRRIKIAPNQTDLFYLAKVETHMDPGFTQQINLFIEMYRFWRGFSMSVRYQYWKHSEDKLSLSNNQYSPEIANSSENLQEWTIHQLIFRADYDTQVDFSQDAVMKPQISAFFKLPFNGRRSLLANTAGVEISFNF